MAGDRGFEPLLTDPESVVLPLDESPVSTAFNFSALEIIAIRKRFAKGPRFAMNHEDIHLLTLANFSGVYKIAPSVVLKRVGVTYDRVAYG